MSSHSPRSGCCFQTFGSPMRFVALANGCFFLIMGIVLSALLYSKNDVIHGECKSSYYHFPPVVFVLALVQFGYVIITICRIKCSLSPPEDPAHLSRSIPFTLCTFFSGVAMACVFAIGHDPYHACVGLGFMSMVFLAPLGGCLAISSLFYLIKVPKLACIPTHKARYWVGLLPISVITMWWWALLCCTRFSPEEAQQVRVESGYYGEAPFAGTHSGMHQQSVNNGYNEESQV